MTEDDMYEIQERICSFGEEVEYTLTEEEQSWLKWVTGRYAIADYLLDRIVEDNIVKLDSDLSAALDMDCEGAGKAVCLSDDSQLQRIFFWCYEEKGI